MIFLVSLKKRIFPLGLNKLIYGHIFIRSNFYFRKHPQRNTAHVSQIHAKIVQNSSRNTLLLHAWNHGKFIREMTWMNLFIYIFTFSWMECFWILGKTVSTMIYNSSLKMYVTIMKSDNLQYNTLGLWVTGTKDSLTKCLMIQVLSLFFITSCKILLKNHLNLFSYFL